MPPGPVGDRLRFDRSDGSPLPVPVVPAAPPAGYSPAPDPALRPLPPAGLRPGPPPPSPRGQGAGCYGHPRPTPPLPQCGFPAPALPPDRWGC
ncbi:MAG: hypothetical protein D6722_01140 [Bacteroidetes bacterium]|nr:MAG: hypothetical protein D6722_01140 [Bacteroidota bacterium]